MRVLELGFGMNGSLFGEHLGLGGVAATDDLDKMDDGE